MGHGGGQDAVVCSVCNALQPVRRLAYRALDWNFIQMSIKRPRLFKENAGGVDSNVASSHGVRFSTVASCWRSQRWSVPSTSQSTRPPSGGAFSRFGVLTVRQTHDRQRGVVTLDWRSSSSIRRFQSLERGLPKDAAPQP